MVKRKQKIGIVLAGGGAKGAYEVGFIRALGEFGIEPDVIAGTSIGALNGCLYASLKNTQDTYKALRKVWNQFKKESPLKIDKLDSALHIADLVVNYNKLLPSPLASKNRGILQTNPIEEILKKNVPIEKIQEGLPFYIAMSEANDTLEDVLHLMDLNRFLSLSRVKTHYLKVQKIRNENIHKCILASAALPFLFDAQEIDGKFYRDGCLGENYDSSANAPVLPLIQQEKCNLIFVCHLDDKVSFAEQYAEFKNVKIIEVIPQKDTFTSALDPLKFNQERIDFWMKRGYQDSKKVLKAFREGKTIKKPSVIKQQEVRETIVKTAIQGLVALIQKNNAKE